MIKRIREGDRINLFRYNSPLKITTQIRKRADKLANLGFYANAITSYRRLYYSSYKTGAYAYQKIMEINAKRLQNNINIVI